jgi:hypothetical protein
MSIHTIDIHCLSRINMSLWSGLVRYDKYFQEAEVKDCDFPSRALNATQGTCFQFSALAIRII